MGDICEDIYKYVNEKLVHLKKQTTKIVSNVQITDEVKTVTDNMGEFCYQFKILNRSFVLPKEKEDESMYHYSELEHFKETISMGIIARSIKNKEYLDSIVETTVELLGKDNLKTLTFSMPTITENMNGYIFHWTYKKKA